MENVFSLAKEIEKQDVTLHYIGVVRWNLGTLGKRTWSPCSPGGAPRKTRKVLLMVVKRREAGGKSGGLAKGFFQRRG